MNYPKNSIPRFTFDPKARHWTFRTYPDPVGDELANNHELNTTIEYRLRMCGASYAYILHDKDKNDDGSPKKPHYHYVVVFPAPRKYSTLKALTGLPDGIIEMCKGEIKGDATCRPMFRYLCHLDHKDKYQYDVSEIQWHGFTDDERHMLIYKEETDLCLEEYYDERAMYRLSQDVRAWAQGLMTFEEVLFNNPSEYRRIHNLDKMRQIYARELGLARYEEDRLDTYTNSQSPVAREWQKTEYVAQDALTCDPRERLELIRQSQELMRAWQAWKDNDEERSDSYESLGR